MISLLSQFPHQRTIKPPAITFIKYIAHCIKPYFLFSRINLSLFIINKHGTKTKLAIKSK